MYTYSIVCNGDINMAALSPEDPCSYSRPDECKVNSLDLNLEVDFDSKKLCGYVDLTVERMKDVVQNLVKVTTFFSLPDSDKV